MRKDGFRDDVEVSLIDPPAGFRLDGNRIPGQLDRMSMTLRVDTIANEANATQAVSDATEPNTKAENGQPEKNVELGKDPTRLQMRGESVGRGRAVARDAIPAENMMQAFIWHHLVPVEHWNVVVTGKGGGRMPFDFDSPPIAVPLKIDGTTYLPIRPTSGSFDYKTMFADVVDPIDRITVDVVRTLSLPAALAIRIDNESLAPEKRWRAGERGNLLLSIHREITPEPTEDNPAPTPRRTQ